MSQAAALLLAPVVDLVVLEGGGDGRAVLEEVGGGPQVLLPEEEDPRVLMRCAAVTAQGVGRVVRVEGHNGPEAQALAEEVAVGIDEVGGG